MRVYAKLVKLSLCDCGARAVWEDVPLGTIYVAQPDHVEIRRWMCRVCGKTHTSNMVYIERRGTSGGGLLFMDLFELDEALIEQ